MELSLNNQIDNQSQQIFGIKTDFKRKIILTIIFLFTFSLLNIIIARFSGSLDKFNIKPTLFYDFFLTTILPSFFLAHYILKYSLKKRLIPLNFLTFLLLYLIVIGLLVFFFSIFSGGEGGVAILYIPSLSLFIFLDSLFVLILVLLSLSFKKINNLIVKVSVIPILLLIIYTTIIIISPMGSCSSFNDIDCVTKLIQKEKDASLCNYLKDPGTCYNWVYTFGYFDEDICNTIKNSKEHESCYCRFTGICDDDSNILKPVLYLLGNWMREKGTCTGFRESREVQVKINSIKEKIKNETGKSVEYIIYTYKENFVVKAKINNLDYFFCSDNQGSVSPVYNKPITIKENNFTAQRYCSGDKCLKNMTNESILCWPE